MLNILNESAHQQVLLSDLNLNLVIRLLLFSRQEGVDRSRSGLRDFKTTFPPKSHITTHRLMALT